MSELKESTERDGTLLTSLARPISRKRFLVWSGVGAALAVTGCSKKTKNPTQPQTGGVDVGTGDTGVLNYAYALEQLEAAFYTQVVATAYSGRIASETQILTDIRDHEVAHRDFLKAALGAKAIPALEVDFSSINFTDRASVLGAARTFEDLGVSAYNGAGQLLTSADLLAEAGKIVSVEARHAAAIRDLLQPTTAYFAGDDTVSASGLDVQRKPSEVLAAADPYIKTQITAKNLP